MDRRGNESRSEYQFLPIHGADEEGKKSESTSLQADDLKLLVGISGVLRVLSKTRLEEQRPFTELPLMLSANWKDSAEGTQERERQETEKDPIDQFCQDPWPSAESPYKMKLEEDASGAADSSPKIPHERLRLSRRRSD